MTRHSNESTKRLIAAAGSTALSLFLLLALIELLAVPARPVAAHPALPTGRAATADGPWAPFRLTLTAAPALATVDDTVAVTAEVETEAGTLFPSIVVTFSTTADLGDVDFNPLTASTNISGQAITVVNSTSPGVKMLIATAQGGVTGTTVVTFAAGNPDHFVFGPIPDPLTAGVGFTLVITAQDAHNNAAERYNSTAALSDESGTLSPVSALFSKGVFSGTFTVTRSWAGDIIHAIDGSISGDSETFGVNPGPAANLDISVSDNAFRPHMTATVVATATDQYANRVLPVTVNFATFPSGLGMLNPADVATINGLASTTFTAGADDGSGLIRATVTGAPAAEAAVEVRLYRLYLPGILRGYPPPWKAGAGSAGKTVYHIAVCPENNETLYAGTEDEGVLKSVDGGATWTSSGLAGELVFAPVVQPGTSCAVLFAATWGAGVQKSTDGGSTWNAASNGLPNNVNLQFIIADPAGTLFAAATDGVFRSGDGGATWTQRGFGDRDVVYLALDPDNSSRIYAGTWGDGIYRTENGGVYWTRVNNGLTGDKQIWALSVAPGTAGQTIIAASNDEGVFLSNNGGASWQRRWPDSYQQTVYSVLALDLDGRLTFFAGTSGEGVYRSSDEGNSWADYSLGLGNQVANFLSASGTYIYVGTADGAYRRPLAR